MSLLTPRIIDAQFQPGKAWSDTDGKPIQAHGGGMLLRLGTYFWFGENKSQGYHNKVGVSCYSSRDLVHWQDEGVVLPKESFPVQFRDTGVCERPKVIYNERTKKFVMWMHVDANGYAVSEAGVAMADAATGPFHWVANFRPVQGSTYRDMNLFLDDDGIAYAFYAGEDNRTMHVVRLNSDFTAPAEHLLAGENWARIFIGQSREAPAPFKWKGRYYVVTSGCTGWAPNAAEVAAADHILGPWRVLSNPCVGDGAVTTFHSQSTFILPVPGERGGFIYMGDRWNKMDLGSSPYVWLPMTVDGDKVQIRNLDRWDFSVFGDPTIHLT